MLGGVRRGLAGKADSRTTSGAPREATAGRSCDLSFRSRKTSVKRKSTRRERTSPDGEQAPNTTCHFATTAPKGAATEARLGRGERRGKRRTSSVTARSTSLRRPPTARGLTRRQRPSSRVTFPHEDNGDRSSRTRRYATLSASANDCVPSHVDSTQRFEIPRPEHSILYSTRRMLATGSSLRNEGPILVTGATGLLGRYLVSAFDDLRLSAVFVGLSGAIRTGANLRRCDLSEASQVRRLLRDVAPSAILHAAALTNVDVCEDEPMRADRVNRGSTSILAEYAQASGARLVYVSTDSVFDGERGRYVETDEPNPLNEYARSKLRGEYAAAEAFDHLIVRTNLFARSERGIGLVEWILRELTAGRAIVGFADVVFSPLHCADLANRLVELVNGAQRGIMHVGSTDAVSKLQFADKVASAYGLERSLIRAGLLSDVQFKARRPMNTALDTTFAASVLSTPLPTVRESIDKMASELPRDLS